MAFSYLDPRRLLAWPLIYSGIRKLAGAERMRRDYSSRYTPALAGQRVLDVGCGLATNLKSWPENVEYVG